MRFGAWGLVGLMAGVVLSGSSPASPQQNTVEHLGDLPAPLTNATAVSIAGVIWIFGGEAAAGRIKYATEDIIRFDVQSRRVDRLEHGLPFPIAGAAATWDGDRVVILGGSTGEVLSFNPDTAALRRTGLIIPREARVEHGAAIVAGGRVYLFGGERLLEDGLSDHFSRDVYEISVDSAAVRIHKDILPLGLASFAVGQDGTTIALVGGRTTLGVPTSQVSLLSVDGEVRARILAPLPRATYGGAAMLSDERLLHAGGCCSGGFEWSALRLDAYGTGEWTSAPIPGLSTRWNFASAEQDGTLITAGGFDDNLGRPRRVQGVMQLDAPWSEGTRTEGSSGQSGLWSLGPGDASSLGVGLIVGYVVFMLAYIVAMTLAREPLMPTILAMLAPAAIALLAGVATMTQAGPASGATILVLFGVAPILALVIRVLRPLNWPLAFALSLGVFGVLYGSNPEYLVGPWQLTPRLWGGVLLAATATVWAAWRRR